MVFVATSQLGLFERALKLQKRYSKKLNYSSKKTHGVFKSRVEAFGRLLSSSP
jgi:hypothetical protein